MRLNSTLSCREQTRFLHNSLQIQASSKVLRKNSIASNKNCVPDLKRPKVLSFKERVVMIEHLKRKQLRDRDDRVNQPGAAGAGLVLVRSIVKRQPKSAVRERRLFAGQRHKTQPTQVAQPRLAVEGWFL